MKGGWNVKINNLFTIFRVFTVHLYARPVISCMNTTLVLATNLHRIHVSDITEELSNDGSSTINIVNPPLARQIPYC